MIDAGQRALVREGLRALGKRRVVLAIHDAAFPAAGEDLDAGRGTPYGAGGRRLVELAARLGFHGVQLGPQGETSPGNTSPYDSTCFSRSVLSIALGSLVQDEQWGRLLSRDDVEGLLVDRPRDRPDRAAHAFARRTLGRLVELAYGRLRALRAAGDATGVELWARLDRFSRVNAAWLEPDAAFEALEAEYGFDWRRWPAVDAAEVASRRRTLVTRYRLGQLLVHQQHGRFRKEAGALGLHLLADLQIGHSSRDEWAHPDAFVPGYRLGAPPSRTNPAGQPWGYPVLDPLAPAARTLLVARVSKLLDEADGLRIDHPHGLVSPWVYRAGAPDPLHAVQAGARLNASPDLEEHPELAGRSIPTPAQLDRERPRHADDWVRGLTRAQVDRYAVLLDAVVDTLRARGLTPADLACEVLSTCPLPLAEVLARHGLGRLRVTGKADILDPTDPYLPERASPNDWVTLSTHDTPSIWALAARWRDTPQAERRAAHLARKLAPTRREQPELARRIATEPGLLVDAMLAELFACPAANVSVHFTDLFGLTEQYNVPGTVNDDNWSLRAPADPEGSLSVRLSRGEALSIPRALALALRARATNREHDPLAERLEELCG